MQRTLSDEDDSRLMGLASDGSEEAFLTLYRRHQRRVFRFALRMSGDEATAEEVVQEVFMMVVRAPERYDSVRASVGAWLLGIARNHVLRALERQSGHVAPVCDDGESAGDEVASESPDVLRNLI